MTGPGVATVHPVAVSGVASLTPLGDRLEVVLDALQQGRSALVLRPDLGGASASLLSDFDATRYATVRGLRLYSRPTRMAIAAGNVALLDAGLDPAAVAGEGLGTVTASTLGHLETLFEYDRSVVASGPLRGNPALMPLALPSSPGAAVALSFVAKAFSLSLSNGATSSLEAVGLGARLVAEGRARTCLVVASSGLCPELQVAAWRAGLLAPDGLARPFDRRRTGSTLGEGAAAVVLERVEDVEARGGRPRGLVLAQSSTFAGEPSRLAGALARACRSALAGSGPGPGDVALVSSGAGGSLTEDRAEAEALVSVLGDAAGRTPVTAIAGHLGNTGDAGGLLQILVALAAMSTGRAPGIAGLEQPEVSGLGYLMATGTVARGRALVTGTSTAGGCAALVLGAGHGA
jgi:3-oxoacyl-[acyl-carrier-protein] synthase II